MRSNGKGLFSLVFVGVCAILLTGCGGSKTPETADTLAQQAIEKAVESAAAKEGVNLDIDTQAGQVVVQGQDGSTSFAYGGDVKLPDNAPSDLPLYPGMTVLGAGSDTQDEDIQYMIMAETGDSPEKVLAFFNEQFPAKGWTNALDEEVQQMMQMMPEVMNMLSFAKDGRIAVVVIAQEGGKTIINIQGGRE